MAKYTHYVIMDDGVIWGVGATWEAALDDAAYWLRTNMPDVDMDEELAHLTRLIPHICTQNIADEIAKRYNTVDWTVEDRPDATYPVIVGYDGDNQWR